MERVSHFIFVSWDGEQASVETMDGESFNEIRSNMIHDGFYNMQIEWYESLNTGLPDRIQVFVYWEYTHIAPSYDLVKNWGLKKVRAL